MCIHTQLTLIFKGFIPLKTDFVQQVDEVKLKQILFFELVDSISNLVSLVTISGPDVQTQRLADLMYKHGHGLTHTRDVIKIAAVCDGRSGKPVSLIVTHETRVLKSM